MTHGQCDARPTVTFPAAERRRPLAGTKLYCLVTEAHGCEQLAQSCYSVAPQCMGSTAEPRPKSNFMHSTCHKTHVMRGDSWHLGGIGAEAHFLAPIGGVEMGRMCPPSFQMLPAPMLGGNGPLGLLNPPTLG